MNKQSVNEMNVKDLRLYWHVHEEIRLQWHKQTWMFMNEWDFNDMNIYEWMRCQCHEYL